MKKLLRTDIEYAVHCDDEGKVIWPISKVHAHMKWVRETLYHYSTWSMVFNPILWKYWIQLKNAQKWSKWDMWVAWHNCYIGDENGYRYLDFEDNLQKEAIEEIWIELKMYEDLDSFLEAYRSLNSGSIWYLINLHTQQNEIKNLFDLAL